MPTILFKDKDALSFRDDGEEDDPGKMAFAGKRKRNSKGSEIIFDPDQHREYVTGFHKRKVERRNKAKSQKAEKERKQRLEEKAERRAKLREQLDLERYETPSEAEEEVKDGAVGRGVKVYRSGDATTTVTVAPLVLNSDEERESEPQAGLASSGEDAELLEEKKLSLPKKNNLALKSGREKANKGRQHGEKSGKKHRRPLR